MDAAREQKIQAIVTELNARGKGIPSGVDTLHPFPAKPFTQLRLGFQQRKYTLFKLSSHYDTELFGLLATGGQKFQSNFGMLVTFLGPIAAIAAGIFVSWWWLLAAPVAFFVGLNINRSAYQTAIFLAALESETAFCLLYFYGQVGVNDMQTGRGYYWDREKNSSVIN